MTLSKMSTPWIALKHRSQPMKRSLMKGGRNVMGYAQCYASGSEFGASGSHSEYADMPGNPQQPYALQPCGNLHYLHTASSLQHHVSLQPWRSFTLSFILDTPILDRLLSCCFAVLLVFFFHRVLFVQSVSLSFLDALRTPSPSSILPCVVDLHDNLSSSVSCPQFLKCLHGSFVIHTVHLINYCAELSLL